MVRWPYKLSYRLLSVEATTLQATENWVFQCPKCDRVYCMNWVNGTVLDDTIDSRYILRTLWWYISECPVALSRKLYIIIIIIITSTSDLQPSTAISNPSPGKSVLNKFKPY